MTSLKEKKLIKADLHVHSYFSGPAIHLKFLRCHDSYSKPVDVYRTAKARGMDLVTITDHDSIDGCLDLLEKHPDRTDFFISEEVTCFIPDMSSNYVHVNVFNINETIHKEVQYLRKNLYETIDYLKKENVLYSLNHMFHGYRNSVAPKYYVEKMLGLFDVFEARNATMSSFHNDLINEILQAYNKKGVKKSLVAGSDAHTLRRIATNYTATIAENKEEFFENLRAGRTLLFGRGAGALTIVGDIYGVMLRYFPNLIKVWTKEFSLPLRMRNMFLSLLAVPFLGVPVIASLRHAKNEKNKLQKIKEELFLSDAGLFTTNGGD